MAEGINKLPPSSFMRVLIPFMTVEPLWPNHFSETPSLNTITLGTKFQHTIFEGTHSENINLLLVPPHPCPSHMQNINSTQIAPISYLIAASSLKYKLKFSFKYHINQIWERLKVLFILKQISLHLWACEIEQVICFQNKMVD